KENSPPPTAESLTRFLRLLSAIETKAETLFHAKIASVLALLFTALRFLTLMRAVPEIFQESRKLVELLAGAGTQLFLAA
ncbi:polycystin cation channel protein, partial [Cystoisospora suis]